MNTFVLAALLAAAVVSGTLRDDNQPQWSWQVGKLYRYDVESYTLAHLHEGASTGSVFRGKFIVRARAPGQLQAKLENPQHATVHAQLPRDKRPPKDLIYQPVPDLDKPFDILVEGGRVVSLNVPASLSVSHENLLKGLIGTLQVDLSSHRSVHDSQNTYDKETSQGQFRKMETDVTGDCETLYTVSPVASEWRRELPNFSPTEEPIEITKSKNYGHCHHRVAYHFGVPTEAEWTGVSDKLREKEFIERSSNSRILLNRQGHIYKAETTSTVHVHPHMYGKQKAEVLSHVRLNLVSYKQDDETEWQKPEENRVVLNLLYSMSPKQVQINDRSSSSESYESQAQGSQERVRRSAKMPKIISINKLIIKKRDDNSMSSSEDSDDSSSTYVNDEVPTINDPAYAALFMNPEPHADKKSNPMNAQKLVQEMAQQLQNPNNMPKADFLSKFNILVRILASMSYDQLSLTSRSIEVAKSSNNIVKTDMWMIYRDAVVQAGTLPAFKQIQFWIQNKKIQGEEAAQVVAALVNTLRYPTKEIMILFFNLAMSPEVTEQKYLNSTALIAATRFINMGQVNNATAQSYYPTYMFGRLARKHDNFVYEEILPRLQQVLEQAIQQGDSKKAQVYIRAIGNLGHRSALDVYAPYLEGKIQTSTYLRTLMVESLLSLARQKDSYVRTVLYNILRNTAEPYEVRVAAIQNIFIAFPSATMMQAMAQMTHDDPSLQVRAALKYAIETAAEMKNPYVWKLAKRAQAARPMLTKEKFGQQYSVRIMDEQFDDKYQLGMMDVLASIGSEDSLLPKYWKYVLRDGTHSNEILTTFSSVQQFIDYAQQQINSVWQHNQKSEHSSKYSADKISEMLNIKRDPQIPLEAALYFNWMSQQRHFTFNEDDLKQLPNTIKEFLSSLSKGVNQHYTKVFNRAKVIVMFPVVTGMPFIYKYKEPTVVHIQGNVKGDIVFQPDSQEKYSASIKKEIQLTFARNIEGSVGFLDTLSDQYANAGVFNKIQLNIPVKVELMMKPGEVKIHLEPLRPEQDTTIVHYSVWPYSANQKKDTLVTVSQDPNTKIAARNNRVSSIDTKFGQTTGTQWQLQGYSYSSDYRSFGDMFQSQDLWSNIFLAISQRDVALTHYNFRYLGKQSQSKKVTFNVVYDSFYNLKENSGSPLTASKMEDVKPNSAERRAAMVKRVASGINTARAKVVDLSATFEGPQKPEYALTAAFADSPIDPKIQYALFASSNSAQHGNNQLNAAGTIHKPQTASLNVLEALKNDLKMTFDADIKFGQNDNGNIRVQGFTDRTKKYAEALQNMPWAKQCLEQIAQNNYYQKDCHKMIVMAHAADYLKASVTYKEVSPAVKYMIYKAARIVESYGFWYADVNPLKAQPDGKLEVEVQNDYLNKDMNLLLNSKYGEARIRNVPISGMVSKVFNTYQPFGADERVANFYTGHQYQPYCTVDDNMIRTFSNRAYDYTLTRSWHVVIQDAPRWQHSDELVVLSRKPSEKKQEILISYQSEAGKFLEIEMRPDTTNKLSVKVESNAKKVSDGALTMYWDDKEEYPFLQYYTQPDGVLMLNIRENRLRVMYDGQRLVVLTHHHRNNTRGICGSMSGEPRDDYLTPHGLVDLPEHYGASFALNEGNSDPQTQQLHEQVKQVAYPRRYHNTAIEGLIRNWPSMEASSEENWGSQNVYRARGYSKEAGPCALSKQVQFYENHGEICITTTPLDSCSAHCSGDGYKVRPAQVVCRPKLDQDFQQYKNQIRQAQNPQVSGVPQIRQYRVPTSCKA